MADFTVEVHGEQNDDLIQALTSVLNQYLDEGQTLDVQQVRQAPSKKGKSLDLAITLSIVAIISTIPGCLVALDDLVSRKKAGTLFKGLRTAAKQASPDVKIVIRLPDGSKVALQTTSDAELLERFAQTQKRD